MKSADVAYITGAGGYLGSRLSAALRTAGVRVIDDPACDLLQLKEARPRMVFHCAGRTSGSAEELNASNVALTESLFATLAGARLTPRVVVPGSAAEYGTLPAGATSGFTETSPPQPSGLYGLSKLQQTKTALAWAARGQDVVVGRIFNIIGPEIPATMALGAFASQLQAIKEGRQPPRLEVGDLTALRDYVDITDVLGALHLLSQRGQKGEIYNICSGLPVAMADLLGMLIDASGLTVEVVSRPLESRSTGTSRSWGSLDKIHKDCQWSPRKTLKQSVEDLAARSFGD